MVSEARAHEQSESRDASAAPGRVENIYHCCVQRTASQWLRFVLGDETVQKVNPYRLVLYRQLGLRFADIRKAFSKGTIVTSLYVDFPTYRNIPKPDRYRTFFVTRDPRDIVVSFYFSALVSHKALEPIPSLRKILHSVDRDSGMRAVIDHLDDWGLFAAQRSWAIASLRDHERLFLYEELAGDHRTFLRALFGHIDFELAPTSFDALCDRHVFAAHTTSERPQGVENRYDHNRKGVVGDHCLYFNRATRSHFDQVTGDLIDVLGYSR